MADSGARALELIAPTHFDLMLADIQMPIMNGVELIKRARRVDPILPVAVMTAYTGDAQLVEATEEGVLAVLAKPLPIPQLLTLVTRAERRDP